MATEKRLIDANALMAELTEENPMVHFGPFGYCGCSPNSDFEEKVFMRERVLKIVESAPTVDAVEVVHGRWKEVTDQDEIVGEMDFYQCSVCGKLRWFETNYCPNCGAKMDGDSE